MTNRRTFLAVAGAAISGAALPWPASANPHPAAAPSSHGALNTHDVEQWLLGKGRSAMSAAEFDFVRSQMPVNPSWPTP